MKERRVLGIISWLDLFFRGMVSSLVRLLIANVVYPRPEPEIKLTIAKVLYNSSKEGQVKINSERVDSILAYTKLEQTGPKATTPPQ